MSSITVLNDLHLGAVRTGGTTPPSAHALRMYLRTQLFLLLLDIDADLLINGDLFDTKAVSNSDLLDTLSKLEWWLINTDKKLYLAAGNHDLSKNSAEMSSFQVLAKLLADRYPTQVFPIYELTEIKPGYWVLPHLPNQDRFDVALSQVPECKYLFVHCNYNNHFAVESDHSLNMDEEQAQACKAETIIFGHEHDRRVALNGKVQVTGNQIASSVMDCLHGGIKTYAVIENDELSLAEMPATPYAEIDWKELDTQTNARFIRVSGQATTEEASAVVTAIAKYRNRSDAFVVTNAVKIGEDAVGEELVVSMEDIQAFDILTALKEILTEEENAAISGLPHD